MHVIATNGNGRPYLKQVPDRTGKFKYTVAEVADAIVESKGLVVTAANKLGCRSQTIYSYLRRFPALREILQTQRELRVDRAEKSLDDAVTAGAPWAVALTLKTLGRSRGYVEKSEVEVTGEITAEINLQPSDLVRTMLDSLLRAGYDKQAAIGAMRMCGVEDSDLDAIDVDYVSIPESDQ